MGASLAQLRRAQAALVKATAKVAALRAQLAVNCTHPADFVGDYRWEHDNGYGRQSWVNGKICQICGAVDNWGRGDFHMKAPARTSSHGE